MNNVNLTKEEFELNLKNLLNKNFQNVDIQSKSLQHDGLGFIICIPGKESFIYCIWEKPDGLSIQIQGKNEELANDILKLLTEDLKTIEQKKQTFVTVTNAIYESIKNHFNSLPSYNIKETICTSTQKNLYIEKGKCKITIIYYNTTQKCILSGNTTALWDEVFFELTDKLNLNVKEVVKLSICSTVQLESAEVNYDDGILEQLLLNILTAKIINNPNLITEIEKNWLKTSIFLLYTEIQLPEYFAAIAPSIKVIEGILNRILTNKGIPKNKDLNYFRPNSAETHWSLLPEYSNQYFHNNTLQINKVNELYTFIQNTRHKYFHNDGYDPAPINQKEKAISIFQEIIKILKNLNYSHII